MFSDDEAIVPEVASVRFAESECVGLGKDRIDLEEKKKKCGGTEGEAEITCSVCENGDEREEVGRGESHAHGRRMACGAGAAPIGRRRRHIQGTPRRPPL